MILFNQEVVGDMKGELLELMQVAKICIAYVEMSRNVYMKGS